MEFNLKQLDELIAQRIEQSSSNSYVASFKTKGMDALLKKIGEEATEVVMASKNEDKQALINELADLWFHSLVLLHYKNCHSEDVLKELQNRFGTSGIAEKQARKN